MMSFKSLLPVVASLTLFACSSTSKDPVTSDAAAPQDAAVTTDGGDAATGASIACYTVEQDRCREFPQPSAEQDAALRVECSSASGVISSPADCPKAGFIGKCTVPGSGKDGVEVRRWYKADDAAYQQDFCVNTANGVWSTTF